MAQWNQGYQYPMQTGFNPQQQFQQQGFQPGGIAPQPTGFPGQQPPRPPQFQQPQQTGFPGQGYQQPPPQLGLQSQPTGFQPQPTGFQGGSFQQRPVPPVPPIPQQFQQQNPTGGSFLGAPPQANRSFLSPSPGPLTAQATGFGGGAGGIRPLMPQQTGFVDPRLSMMSNTFMPANPSLPFNPSGMPQLQQQPVGGVSLHLQQSFMQHNQAQRGSATPKVPWALSKAEKKSYDQIFRAWDRGEGFISGQTALEVFGQSGLDKNERSGEGLESC
ncbi:hypothetical protein EIP91_001399 [Steccherinum ochraceum]|uniref:Uncharacterized protein n=1 Tax=Steccherinum ochraceum TaxID=92696 RepID=A0A4R0RRE7_9APHY|nr:hypothetical protein EIP91_001399 [Steccherinum ochraceum]